MGQVARCDCGGGLQHRYPATKRYGQENQSSRAALDFAQDILFVVHKAVSVSFASISSGSKCHAPTFLSLCLCLVVSVTLQRPSLSTPRISVLQAAQGVQRGGYPLSVAPVFPPPLALPSVFHCMQSRPCNLKIWLKRLTLWHDASCGVP